MTTNPLTSAAVEQLQWHWQNLLRPRLEGLTDEELLWDPTGDDQQAWTVHSADEQRTAHQAGAGDLVIDFDLVEGQPQPFTTISWRLGHAIVGVLAARSHSHFDAPTARGSSRAPPTRPSPSSIARSSAGSTACAAWTTSACSSRADRPRARGAIGPSLTWSCTSTAR